MRYLFSYICLSLIFCNIALCEENLISKNQLLLLENSDSITALPLEKMRYSPRFIDIFDPNEPSNIKLNSEQKKKLIKILSSSVKIKPQERLNNCKYLPGVSFNFHTNSNHVNKVTSILLCFNCDLWAINNENIMFPSVKDTIAFGNSKAEREQLISLVKELFGQEFIK